MKQRVRPARRTHLAAFTFRVVFWVVLSDVETGDATSKNRVADAVEERVDKAGQTAAGERPKPVHLQPERLEVEVV